MLLFEHRFHCSEEALFFYGSEEKQLWKMPAEMIEKVSL
jgi:hypothetical protein